MARPVCWRRRYASVVPRRTGARSSSCAGATTKTPDAPARFPETRRGPMDGPIPPLADPGLPVLVEGRTGRLPARALAKLVPGPPRDLARLPGRDGAASAAGRAG